MTQLTIISIYLVALLLLGIFSSKLFRGTSKDYMLASHSIGPFLLLMSLFGTTMTAFALVGSTGESFKKGVGVYGMLASSSGIIHSLCFFLLGIKLWSWGKKYGYTTQIQFFRDRLESDKIGILLFPVLVGLVIPYLLIGVMASGTVISSITEGAFQTTFAAYDYGIPPWLGSLVISCVVLIYVFFGGMRGTAWANTFQTIIFMVLGVVTFFIISDKLGGMQAASEAVLEKNPSKLTRGVAEGDQEKYNKSYTVWEKKAEYNYVTNEQGKSLTPDETKQALSQFTKRMPAWQAVAKTAFALKNKKEWFKELTTEEKSKARILQDDRLIPDPFPEEYTNKVIDAHGLTLLKRRPLGDIKKDAHEKFKQKIGHPNEFANPDDESKGKKWSLKKSEGVYRATTWAPQKPIPIPMLAFLTYMFVPLSVGMFPHLFQHWLTAKSANSFKLSVVAHPIFIMLVWVPCVLVGVWATSATLGGRPLIPAQFPPNAVLPYMVKTLTGPILAGFLTVGILSAIMSSLDSQFLCIGTIFTEDIVLHYSKKNKYTDKQIIMIARFFIIAVVALTYFFSLQEPRRVFTLGVWCFSGFSSLFPLILAAVYWRGLTKPGAYASILTAAGTWCYLFYKSNYAANSEFLFLEMMPVATMVACSAAALVLVSLVTKPPSDQTLSKFFPEKS